MTHKCCVIDCEELVKETRAKGLPLHKFPKDLLLRAKWLTSGGFPQDFKPTNSQIVCYKHFKQHDYEIGRSHKLFLKKGSVPSVFANYQQHPDPITPDSHLIVSRLQAKFSAFQSQGQVQTQSQASTQSQVHPPSIVTTDCPDVSPGANLDSSCSSLDASVDSPSSLPNGNSLSKAVEPLMPVPVDLPLQITPVVPSSLSSSLDLDSVSVPAPVHPQSLAAMKTKTGASKASVAGHSQQQQLLTPNSFVQKKTLNNESKLRTYSRTDLTFLPGSKLEAKDFNEKWYSARVVETDWGEREVLIHFDKWSSRFDEWIPMDSSRLRTLQLHSKDTKPREFVLGERILATWVDGKKYPAKISTILGNDKYDVLFDDGYSKILRASKMTKLLEIPPTKQEEDYTYLGSKQERRDKKRKHTVSELFQHKKKVKSEQDKICKKHNPIEMRSIKCLTNVEPEAMVKTESLPKLDSHSNLVNAGLDEDYATYIGNLRVEIEDSTYKCPKSGCNKNFRKENLLQMHIKHYHPEYSKFLGSTPNVADLAYARTIGESFEDFLPKKSKPVNPSGHVAPGVAFPVSQLGDVEFTTADIDSRLENKFSVESNASIIEDNSSELSNSYTMSPGRLFDIRSKEEKIHTGIKTLPPVRQPATLETDNREGFPDTLNDSCKSLTSSDKGKTHKKRQLQNYSDLYGKVKKPRKISENDESCDQYDDSLLDGGDGSEYKCHDSTNGQAEPENEMFQNNKAGDIMVVNGEIIKVEKLKREEIINCTCGITEEDGLMIQCDLCLCWQHGHCNAIEKEKDVPEKYVCYICQHSHRQRTSQKYFHDQDWIKEGKLPSLYVCLSNKQKINERAAMLKRSCDLIAGLLQIHDLLNSLRVKVNIAENKDHQKLYLWAKNWSNVKVPRYQLEPVPIMRIIKNKTHDNNDKTVNEKIEFNFSSKLDVDKKLITSDTELMQILEEDNPQLENVKIFTKNLCPNNCKNDKHILLNALTKPESIGEDQQLFRKYELHSGNTPPKLKLMAKHIASERSSKIPSTIIHIGKKTLVTSQPVVPEPEAPIDPVECKLRLLEHIHQFQNYVNSTLNFLESQLSALENVSENDKFNDNHSQTKQTVQMLLYDLESIRKLAALCNI